MFEQQILVVDGTSYRICLPDAETDYIQQIIAIDKQPYELAMLRDMASRLVAGDVVLDVGANVGNHTLYLANVAGAQVHAFEPNTHLCAAIEASARLNNLQTQITVYPRGVADRQGTAQFAHLDPANLGAQRLEVIPDNALEITKQSTIELVALDQLDWSNPIRMIKVDVEGMEIQVLHGAKALIQRDKPILYIECQTANDFNVVGNFLKVLGYLYCNTFNATPTHVFVHQESLSLASDIPDLLADKAQQQYIHAQQLGELRDKLQDCNLKYRDANERLKQLAEQKDQTSVKYREATSQISSLKLEIEKLKLKAVELELAGQQKAATQAIEIERALLQLEQQKHTRDVELTKLALEKQFADKEVAGLTLYSEDLKQQLTEIKEQLLEKQEYIRQANEKYRQVTGHQVPELKEKLSEHKQQVAELTNTVDLLRQQSELAQASLRSQCQALGQQFQDTKQKLAKCNIQLQETIAQYREVTERQVPELKSTISTHEQTITALQQVVENKAERQTEYERLQAEYSQALRQLTIANDKYRKATGDIIPQLKNKLDNQNERSKELQQRAEHLNRELEQTRQEKAEAQRVLSAMRSSATFKAGAHIRAARHSLKDALKLPLRLWRLRKQSQPNIVKAQPLLPNVPPKPLAQAVSADHAALSVTSLTEKPNKQVRMACVMDDFTYGSFAPECELFQLTPGNWHSELEVFQPEVLFIESAWRGKDELWGSKIGHCSQELQCIVAWCREHNIPTLFWNKEDPAHFETFLTTAKLFDFVFTTDMDCIHRYKAALGHNYVYFLPFACQPAVNNPIEKYERKDAFCFAGAYYVRYPERTRDLESFVKELPAYKPLEIYDRNYGKDDPNYQFPADYQSHIVGTLPYAEIDKAYKSYRFAINLNSIKQSQTMFARRVYELLASNTVTLSNFSRGVRLMFGDLVITSDNGAEIRRRLEDLDTNHGIDRLRLAGLRKVMSEHTYADRLNYVIGKVTGKLRARELPAFTVIALANNQQEVDTLIAQVVRQHQVKVRVVLVCGCELLIDKAENALQIYALEGKTLLLKSLNNQTLQELAGDGDWLAGMVFEDYYGPNYLYDLALTTRYSQALVVGKAAYYLSQQGLPELQHAELTYQQGLPLATRRAVIHPTVASQINAGDWCKELSSGVYTLADQLSIDAFNYCENAGHTPADAVLQQVNDIAINQGISLSSLTDMAETIEPMQSELEYAPWLDGALLVKMLSGESFTWLNNHGLGNSINEECRISLCGNKAINTRLIGSLFEVSSQLPDGKHEYLYAKKDYELESLKGLLSNSDLAKNAGRIPLHLEIDPGLNLSLVVLYLNKGKERLGHEVLMSNRNLVINPTEGTEYLRFGLRVYASGSTHIHRLVLGHLDLEPTNILGQSDVLLLTNHYPSNDDLYRNGFVHSRVKAYLEHNISVDIFRLRKDQPISWHEFQNIDVITGSQNALRRMLASGRYRHVLVHFLDSDMWDVLKDFIDTVKVTVWVHGAEIHPWYRRKFNIETLEQEKQEQEKSGKRMLFWKTVLNPMPVNLHMVFVSRTFSQEVMEDIGFELPEQQYSIIHNPINTELFNYQEKPVEQRKKLLSIRPFSSKQYANDISVSVIQELAKYDFFNELDIRMIGDGKLFDETVAPIKDYPNVTLDRRFVTHQEIAALHKEYGIFLCPTRWDSQGVSRDEAMSSGLVVATTAIAAIPEFVDEHCAILAPPENAIQLAQGIAALQNDEQGFKQRSLAATNRVQKQTAAAVIVRQELLCFAADK